MFADYKINLDAAYYADTTGDGKPDVAVGRIDGLSSSDVSSYIARDLFLSSSPKTNNVKLLASSFGGNLKKMTDNIKEAFTIVAGLVGFGVLITVISFAFRVVVSILFQAPIN